MSYFRHFSGNLGIRNLFINFKFITGISLTLSTFAISFGGLKAADKLQKTLLNHTFKLPLIYFYDTPSGIVLNRFTNDIQTIDTLLPINFRDWTSTAFTVISIFLLFSFQMPMIILFLIAILVVYFYILSFYITSSRQLKRMELNSMSPILSHFTESLNGKSIIRAFKNQKL